MQAPKLSRSSGDTEAVKMCMGLAHIILRLGKCDGWRVVYFAPFAARGEDNIVLKITMRGLIDNGKENIKKSSWCLWLVSSSYS